MYFDASGRFNDPEFQVTRDDDGVIVLSSYLTGRSLYLSLEPEEARKLLDKLAELLVED